MLNKDHDHLLGKLHMIENFWLCNFSCKQSLSEYHYMYIWCLTLELNMVNRQGPPPWLRGQFRRRVLVIIRGVACLICHVHFSCERFLAVAAFSSALASPVWQCCPQDFYFPLL